MKITCYSHDPSKTRIKECPVGGLIVGTRLTEITITNKKELQELLSEKGIKWAVKHLLPSFKT